MHHTPMLFNHVPVTVISSPSLELVAATKEHIEIELYLPAILSSVLNAEVPSSWPPGEYDRDAMHFFYHRLAEGGYAACGWYSWYAIRCSDDGGRTLVGAGGYFGPPSDGVVEIGYSIVKNWRGQGLASEIVGALAEHAATLGVHTLKACTLETNLPSIKVLLKNGFKSTGHTDKGATVFTRRL